MVECESIPVLQTLSDASAMIVEGEVMQMVNQGNIDTAMEDYFEVVEAKTSALFASACAAGAMLADANPRIVKAFHDYGYNLGVAFQIADDVLDYMADQEKLGKTVGDDFREGKVTLPVVFAYREGKQQEKAFWRRTMAEHQQKEGDLQTALQLIQKHDALNECLSVARNYGMAASAALSELPSNPITDHLMDIVEYSISRAG
jgi:octaprenyl-diphosphate synthase